MSSDSFYKMGHTSARSHDLSLTERLTNAVRGVISDGFMTIVQPTASAGATFHALDPMRAVPELECIWHTTFE